ncbi:ATP-binding protein [Chitinophaga niabensis]|uniref:AAA family ATPase n=1 Tax=Chitinophaga niabensis TaxID=536979 RepID=UPI0031BB09BB
MESIIGREQEKTLLSRIERSGEAELVAIYGRRRVGKTFLIRNFFHKQLAFEFSGIHNASLDQQLENFSDALTKAAGSLPLAKPASWIQAFRMLTDYITPLIKKKRRVIFLDEFPWIHTPRSGFMQAFENFWNTWASKQNNLIVIICGSAAAWMIQKVINNRGGLYNRVTRRIRLLPFTIGETAAFLKERKINLDRYQILQLYMAMGGVPQYLKEVESGQSASQVIDRICFTKDGLLHDEFKHLFHSLFDDASYHMEVIRALAKKGAGLTRNEIIETCKLTSGGGTTQLLAELTESGFISAYIPFDKTAKDIIYKLTDEYSLFYVKFIENSKFKGPGSWMQFSTGSSWKSWSGIAFESICMKHTDQLKKALGISGVHTESSMWRNKPLRGQQGIQIDLLIDRQDMCINLCEIKFSISEYEIPKGYAKELENKLTVFRDNTKTKKSLFLTMITTYGVKNIKTFPGLIQTQITMDALF